MARIQRLLVPGIVAFHTIRLRILKVAGLASWGADVSSSIPHDPSEDTESRMGQCDDVATVVGSIPHDPSEDTESILVTLQRVKQCLVAFHTIRLRILKVARSVAFIAVAPSSIPHDPSEDTESIR